MPHACVCVRERERESVCATCSAVSPDYLSEERDGQKGEGERGSERTGERERWKTSHMHSVKTKSISDTCGMKAHTEKY